MTLITDCAGLLVGPVETRVPELQEVLGYYLIMSFILTSLMSLSRIAFNQVEDVCNRTLMSLNLPPFSTCRSISSP